MRTQSESSGPAVASRIGLPFLMLCVFFPMSALAQRELKPETYVYKTVGSCRIKADVFRAEKSGGRSPAIVWIHGGALIFNSRTQINRDQLAQYLSAGYTVVAVDYRLAPATKLPQIVEDLKDAFRWLRSEGPGLFGVDPDRIGVTGGSAGGYLALLTGTVISPRPRAIAAFYGYGEMIDDWETKPWPPALRRGLVSKADAFAAVGTEAVSEPAGNRFPFYIYCRQTGQWPQQVVGWDPAKEREKFIPFCPLYNVGRDYPPTILLHGDKDEDVPYEESVRMAKALSAQGIRNELVTIPGGPHLFDNDMTRPETQDAFKKVLALFAEHVKSVSR